MSHLVDHSKYKMSGGRASAANALRDALRTIMSDNKRLNDKIHSINYLCHTNDALYRDKDTDMRRNSYLREYDDFYGNLSSRVREARDRELVQCPVEDCDGSGHISGNFATHRRQAAETHLQLFAN